MTEEIGVESEAVETSSADAENLGEAQAECGEIVFMMAPCEDPTQRPELADFVQVDPCTLSAASISFYCDDAITVESIVLLMGKLNEDPIYVSAVVTSCDEGVWKRKRRHLVGCELTGRL